MMGSKRCVLLVAALGFQVGCGSKGSDGHKSSEERIGLYPDIGVVVSYQDGAYLAPPCERQLGRYTTVSASESKIAYYGEDRLRFATKAMKIEKGTYEQIIELLKTEDYMKLQEEEYDGNVQDGEFFAIEIFNKRFSKIVKVSNRPDLLPESREMLRALEKETEAKGTVDGDAKALAKKMTCS